MTKSSNARRLMPVGFGAPTWAGLAFATLLPPILTRVALISFATRACAEPKKPASVDQADDELAPESPEASEDSDDSTVDPAREKLLQYGFEQGRLLGFRDGRDAIPDEQESLLRCLGAIQRFRPADLAAWTRRENPDEKAEVSSGNERGRLYHVEGRARRLTVIELDRATAERFPFARIYRLEIDRGENRPPAIVYSLTRPEAWKPDAPIDEPTDFAGFFLKFAATEDRGRVAVFASQRLAWRPGTWLGRLGMDVSLLDSIKDSTTLGPDDSECFYAMLQATSRSAPGVLLNEAEPNVSVVPLFNEPKAQRGRLVGLSGVARRAFLVRVDDERTRERFGIDHFYQVDFFTDDSGPNPLVIDVLRLPPGFPEGEHIAERIRVAGFFLKRWKFRPQFVNRPETNPAAKKGVEQGQLAPLLIGADLEWRENRPVGNPSRDAIWGAGFVGLLMVFLGGWWWYQRREKERLRQLRARENQAAPALPAGELEISTEGTHADHFPS